MQTIIHTTLLWTRHSPCFTTSFTVLSTPLLRLWGDSSLPCLPRTLICGKDPCGHVNANLWPDDLPFAPRDDGYCYQFNEVRKEVFFGTIGFGLGKQQVVIDIKQYNISLKEMCLESTIKLARLMPLKLFVSWSTVWIMKYFVLIYQKNRQNINQ